MTEETWEDRFKRAVATYAGVPNDVPLSEVDIQVRSEEGYRYSSWTFADPNLEVVVRGPNFYKSIYGIEDVANLIRSFVRGS